jgi:hypothetical protein
MKNISHVTYYSKSRYPACMGNGVCRFHRNTLPACKCHVFFNRFQYFNTFISCFIFGTRCFHFSSYVGVLLGDVAELKVNCNDFFVREDITECC